MDDMPDIAEVKGIIEDLEGQAAASLAQYHRIQGALETWRGIQKAMIMVAMAERGKREQDDGTTER